MNILYNGLKITALMCVLFLSSCFNQGDGKTPNKITYDTIKVAKIYHLENDSTKPSCSLKVSYVFPSEFAEKNILTKIQGELNAEIFEDDQYLQMSPQDALAKYAEDYVENYKKEAGVRFPNWAQSDDAEDYFSFYKTIESQILFDKGGLISYQVSSMDYKGGANSSKVYSNMVIDLQTGNLLSEGDIFIHDYKNALNQILIANVLNQNKVKATEELMELGFYDIEQLTSNDNFTVDGNGITYILNRGEYSAPSLGEIRINLPYSAIRHLLKNESPISKLFE